MRIIGRVADWLWRGAWALGNGNGVAPTDPPEGGRDALLQRRGLHELRHDILAALRVVGLLRPSRFRRLTPLAPSRATKLDVFAAHRERERGLWPRVWAVRRRKLLHRHTRSPAGPPPVVNFSHSQESVGVSPFGLGDAPERPRHDDRFVVRTSFVREVDARECSILPARIQLACRGIRAAPSAWRGT